MKNTIEIDRYMTARGFWNACEKRMKDIGDSLENWAGTFDQWAENGDCNRCYHDDWDDPKYEIFCDKPFNCQMFLSGEYNFILEFDFWDEKHGFGYFYYNC